MRVLVDTNVLVSILLRVSEGGAVHAIFEAIVSGELTLLLPDQLIDELTTTVRGKPRLAKRILPEELERFVALLRKAGERVPTIGEPFPAVIRDPDDDYLLAYALIASADYLVTGDKDLLALQGKVTGLTIVTPAQLAELLELG